MAGKEDVEFTFSPDSFIKGVQKMNDAMNTFEVKTKDKGEKVNKTTGGMSSFLVAKGMMMANVFMGAFGKAFDFIKNGLPEVGRAMSIASGIIQRNLLWPLRKELAPMLQKMLDWVRDHRAMFVRWGGALVNIFRAITQIVKGAIAMWTTLLKPIADKLKSLFSGTASSISDVFNIVLFKITAVIMFLQVAFMPLLQKVGDFIAWNIEMLSSFFSGFADGISGISGPFSDLLNQFNELLDLLGMSTEQTSVLSNAFGILGDFIGSVLYTAVSAIAQLIDSLVSKIKSIGSGISWLKSKISGDKEAAKKEAEEMMKMYAGEEERAKKRNEEMGNKWSGFGERTVARFSPSSATSSKQVNANQKVNIEKMEIKIAQGEDPKKAGAEFIEGMNKKMSQQFKGLIMNEMSSQGF